MKSISIAIAITFLLAAQAQAQPLTRVYGVDGTNGSSATNPFPAISPSVSLSNGTSRSITVTTAAQTITFPTTCTQITINNTDSTNILYFQPFGGAASTANFPIGPGQAFTWSAAPGLTQISLYASGSSTIGVLAH